jgi:hypothetical protein
VVFRLPTLKFLDSSPVTDWERNEAKRVGHMTGVVVRPKEEAYNQAPEADPDADNIKALPDEFRSLEKTGGASFTKTKYVRRPSHAHTHNTHMVQHPLLTCFTHANSRHCPVHRSTWDDNQRVTGLSSMRTCNKTTQTPCREHLFHLSSSPFVPPTFSASSPHVFSGEPRAPSSRAGLGAVTAANLRHWRSRLGSLADAEVRGAVLELLISYPTIAAPPGGCLRHLPSALGRW